MQLGSPGRIRQRDDTDPVSPLLIADASVNSKGVGHNIARGPSSNNESPLKSSGVNLSVLPSPVNSLPT